MSRSSPGAAPRGRLLRKYIVVFVGLVGGVLMASSLVELYFAYQETKGTIVREERATAVATAAKIEEFARDIERRVLETTRAASDDPAAAQLGLGKLAFRGGLGASLSEQRQLDFLRLLRDVPAISELGHLDVSGKEQLRVSRLALDAVGSQEDFSQAPKFLETRSGKTYWSPVYFRSGVQPYVTFAVPVGQYAVEVTTAEISLKAVQQAIAQTRVGRGGYAYVVDSRGRLFAHPDMGLVRAKRDLSALPQVRDARAERPAAPGGPPGSTPPPASGTNEAVTVAEGLRGGQILAAHAAIAPLGWLVVVERPLAEAYAPLRAPIVRSAVIFVLGLALSVLASILLARRMVAPIRELQEGASRIGAGDLAHRVNVRTGDELEALGSELNRTAGQLEESYSNLEQKVEARTRELAEANAGLTEALEQQTATAEILRAISGSPTDIQPVLDTVVHAAARFCGAADVAILRLEGTTLRGAAAFGRIKDVIVGQLGSMAALEVPVTRRSVTGRAVVDRATVLVHDLAAEPEDEFPEGRALQARFGHHTMVAAPLLREGTPIGAIALFRMEVESFSERQLDLLRLFADQAVIAIENVRLFTELETKNRDLTETLEQQTATSEILRVISSSPTDVQPVFDIIGERAEKLCDAEVSVVARVDGDMIHLTSLHGMAEQGVEIVRLAFPMRRTAETVVARVIRTAAVVRVEDVLADPEYEQKDAARAGGFRGSLGVPMVREGQIIGAIFVARATPWRFADGQVELLKTFADQAVIAIENVRLFTELAAKNRDLTETLEQQTATSEILRVISSSPTNVQPVFDTIAQSAARLCEAQFCHLFRFDGTQLHFVAHHGLTQEGEDAFRRTYPIVPDRGSAGGRAVLSGAIQQVPDVYADPDYRAFELARVATFRSIAAVPMVREGRVIGSVNVGRAEAGRFSDRQIELLKTFADQAVIAIENVRLFTELEVRNRDLTETLEQQTATAEILRVISSSPTDVQPVFDTIVRNARALCAADSAGVFTYDGEIVRLESLDNTNPEQAGALRNAYPMPASRGHATGRAILTGLAVHIPDVREDPEYTLEALRDNTGLRTILSVPMIRDGIPIGAISLQGWGTARAFSDRQVALLKTFADQAVIAIENVRLFTELEARNAELTGSLARQMATGEVLRAISRAQTDAQPVFDIIAASALRLCGGGHSGVWLYDGKLLHVAALANVSADGAESIRSAFPMPADERSLAGRAILARSVVQIADVLEDPAYGMRSVAQAAGFRAFLSAPMLRGVELIGVIGVSRPDPGPFPESQVELLKTFADQAVIAIENVRLFKELETKNADLTATLEQQTATGEILRVISSSPTDTQPVFDTIAERAMHLCGASSSGVLTFDGELVHIAALANVNPEGDAALRSAFPMRPSLASGSTRAILTRSVVQIPDNRSEPGYEIAAQAQAGGFRSVLSLPMLREGKAIGCVTVGRPEPGPFTDRQIALLKTFADQAVIAIENVRLFKELETKNRDLTETLEQQTATSEVLKVISRSAFDLQPVLQTLIENAARLGGADGGVIYKFDGEVQRMAAAYGLSPELRDYVERNPLPPGRGTAVGRALLERRPIHIEDVLTDPAYTYSGATRGEYRTILGVPMLREGVPIGVFAVTRNQVQPFTDKQIELVTTFADQGAIAIENVRLFTELEARTGDLTRSVGELRALGEVSQAVSSTLDLDAVLATIVSRAVELSGSSSGIVYEFDEALQEFHARATHRITAEYLEILRGSPIRLGEGAMGHAGVIREPVEVADIEAERQLVAPQLRAELARQGNRSLLALPLAREDRLLGGLVMLRSERGAFSPEVVATLRTFAAQSVLAIHNAGLFREIQQQKQYSDALVQTSPVAIVTLDLDGKVTGWNPGAERLFQYPQEEALGHTMEQLVATPEVRDEIRANIRQTLGGEWIRGISQRARKDGTRVDVEISSMPVVVEGNQVGMIAIYHDITELLRARREAEAANEAKGAFLATMSHEIRTPLNAVIGMSGLLLNTPLADEQREYAEIVRQSGDALLTVINDILDFSKIEAGRLELESQPFDLRECVEGALDLVATRAAEKGLDLAYLVGDGTPAAIVGDVTRLRQVLLNLLSNAVKFTERGEVVLSVSGRRLDGADGLHEVTFCVRDTGIGIPADRIGRLFQSFSQVDASTTRRYGGTGLGLAISQRLTELMGGRISVTSEVGAGAEFRFSIRATAAAEVPVPTRRDLSGVQPSLRGKRVLVVDDNATNRLIVTTHLGTWGLPERATESPREALAWVQAGERFDVGILDMHMPEMDGVALARAIREQPAGAELPLILFTSLGRREARAEGEGFAAYLHKPIKPSQLYDALVSVLGDQPVHVPERGVARSEFDADMARRHPLRILLAEDNVVNQKVALRLLGQMGYRADVAANGLEAIDAVGRQTYDVILMDVQMPELDGFEASREINRRWPSERRPRIVAMTANAMQGDRELCTAAGMDDYVAKPVRIEELVAALERSPRRTEGATHGATAVAAGELGTPGTPRQSRASGRRGTSAEGRQRTPARDGGPEAGAIDGTVVDRLTATMGAAFVAELIQTFIEDGRGLVASLRRALSAADIDTFRRAAHSLKSTGETVGAMGLAAIARELETTARAGSLEGAEARLAQVDSAFEIAAHTLEELRRGLPA